MNRFILVFIHLLYISYPCFGYELSICCIFQNDSKYLPEWIEFHQDRGVEHFYLYNNLSEDNYKEILDPYIRSGLVEVFEWPFRYKVESQWTKIQCDAYMDCIRRIHQQDTWCAFLDTDEFLFSPLNHDIKTTLNLYSDCVGIGVNWVMYGTSDVEQIPDGEKMLDHLVKRSSLDFYGNDTPKSIVRPRYVETCINPHNFFMKNDLPIVNENKVIIPMTNFTVKNSVKKLRINHYWSRDKDFFYNVKLPRRLKWYPNVDEQIKLESMLNDVYDPILSSK